MQANSVEKKTHHRDPLLAAYHTVRSETERLCAPLVIEDYQIQTMDDTSPPKWHLAHVSWFFETFLLAEFAPSYRPFHPQFDHLFNSYYVTHGKPFLRPKRGFLSRPTVEEVYQYRAHVDAAMNQLINNADALIWPEIEHRITLGLHHEQQHQELLYTDIKHNLAQNPLLPVYRPQPADFQPSQESPLVWNTFSGGLKTIGQQESTFAYDNEFPVHKVYLNDFQLASRPVSNADFIEFIEDGGYQRPDYWFSEGWATVNKQDWTMPMYWQKDGNLWSHFTLHGLQPLDLYAPACHLSHFEADAYARWVGKRLPTEFEWEVASHEQWKTGRLPKGNLMDFKSNKALTPNGNGNTMFGDVWEWTASPYTAYPGYRPTDGAIGEYNGKFMSMQLILRGGSFATPRNHIRPSYRNFFYPADRWQFSGVRLADDA